MSIIHNEKKDFMRDLTNIINNFLAGEPHNIGFAVILYDVKSGDVTFTHTLTEEFIVTSLRLLADRIEQGIIKPKTKQQQEE